MRIFISNPTLPTRWSQPVPIARIEAAARTVSAGVTRLEEVTRQRREPATTQTSGPPVVLVVGTLDTKGAELRFIRDIIAGQRPAHAAGRRLHQRQGFRLRRLRSGDRAEPRPRRIERVRRRPRRIGDGDGGCLCQMAAPPGQYRRHHLRGRFGRRLAGRARHARPARRRAEDDRLVGRLGRCRPLCRTCRHHDDVFGDRRAGPQFDLARGARQRRERAGRHGQGAPRRAHGQATRRGRQPSRHRHHHVRRDDACGAKDRGRPARRVRMPGVPRHRRRRPLDGEAGRLRPVGGGHRSHHHRSLRPPDGRRVSGHATTASARSSAAACPMSARSARSTWSISARRTRFPNATASASSTSTIRRSR